MTKLRDSILTSLWRDRQLQALHCIESDMQGWNFDHPYLVETIDQYRPGLVIEVGVWKGASTIKMAQRIKECGFDGCVVAVDTWLGSAEHWLRDDDASHRIPRWPNGSSKLFDLFMSNVEQAGVKEYVVPLPLDSVSAASVVGTLGVPPVVLHLDASHDEESVGRDLNVWWPLITVGGVLIADDYGDWPSVTNAVNRYFKGHDIQSSHGKCRIVKNA